MFKKLALLIFLHIPVAVYGDDGDVGHGEWVRSLTAGTNITLSPTNGIGDVTVTASGGGGLPFQAGATNYLNQISTGMTYRIENSTFNLAQVSVSSYIGNNTILPQNILLNGSPVPVDGDTLLYSATGGFLLSATITDAARLASTQTYTAQNTFNNSVLISSDLASSSQLGTRMYRSGTAWRWDVNSTYELEINQSSLNAQGQVLGSGGTCGTPAFAGTGDSNTGWAPAGAEVGILCGNGVERARWDNSGFRVGTSSSTAVRRIEFVSGAIDWGTLAASTCAVTSIGVYAGLLTNNAVLIPEYPTSVIENDGTQLFNAWVSSATGITVRRCNIGTVTLGDPASATFGFWVVRN